MLLMMPLAALAAPLSLKVGQKRLTALGLLIGAIGMAWFVTLDAQSNYLQFLVGMLILSVGIGLAMTPATTAIVNSLPIAKQGVASAVNDTAREVGGALGVAILGSAFNTAYRDSISQHVSGLPPDVASGAKEAPGIAFENARNLGGSAGADLTAATQHAFESGLRAAVVISAALFFLGAVYTWWRGPSANAEAPADADADIDDEAADLDLALAPAPAGGR
jgi:MFS family permease